MYFRLQRARSTADSGLVSPANLGNVILWQERAGAPGSGVVWGAIMSGRAAIRQSQAIAKHQEQFFWYNKACKGTDDVDAGHSVGAVER